ncbi:MAG: NTP transferase domain-containing protein [Candidatus Electryonea clarkiae]|nr:NTP transferase domain-containing protein [Candidatus Electryonea clarkiae]MDP8288664.1 NTP transferase domain-containing protein [Candidatus Electryonea clarkiae]
MQNNQNLATIILAAGHGKRMKSDLPKVLHKVGGKTLIEHVVKQAKNIGADSIIVVVGYKRDQVIPVVTAAGVDYVVQEEQLGTGHAVRMTEKSFSDYTGDILILSGDVPLLTKETLERVFRYHIEEEAVATMITAVAPNPTGYGRVLRDKEGNVSAIREHKDCSTEELQVNEINSGIYYFKAAPMYAALKTIKNNNAQAEYYLPDVFHQYFAEGKKVSAMTADFNEIHGINTREDLEEASQIFESTGLKP